MAFKSSRKDYGLRGPGLRKGAGNSMFGGVACVLSASSRKDYELGRRVVVQGRDEKEVPACARCVVGASSRKDYELRGVVL